MQATSLFLLAITLLLTAFSTATVQAQVPSTAAGWIVQTDATDAPTTAPTTTLLRVEPQSAKTLSLQQTASDASSSPVEVHSPGVAAGAVAALVVAGVAVGAMVYKAKTRRDPLLPVGAYPSPTTPMA